MKFDARGSPENDRRVIINNLQDADETTRMKSSNEESLCDGLFISSRQVCLKGNVKISSLRNILIFFQKFFDISLSVERENVHIGMFTCD